MLSDDATPKRRLSANDVRGILHDIGAPCPCCGRPPTLAMVAEHYGVSRPMVSHIVAGRRWADVPLIGVNDG